MLAQTRRSFQILEVSLIAFGLGLSISGTSRAAPIQSTVPPLIELVAVPNIIVQQDEPPQCGEFDFSSGRIDIPPLTIFTWSLDFGCMGLNVDGGDSGTTPNFENFEIHEFITRSHPNADDAIFSPRFESIPEPGTSWLLCVSLLLLGKHIKRKLRPA